MKMNGKTYDIMKFVVWLWIPLATLIATLCAIWFPDASWIQPLKDTFIAVEVFLGALVSKSNYDYNKARGESEDEDATND